MSSDPHEGLTKIDITIEDQIFKPEHFKVSDRLYHLETKFISHVTATREIPPTKKEVKLMQKKFVVWAQKQLIADPLVKIGGTRMIVAADENGKSIAAFSADVFVTIFTGKGRPKVDDVARYERVYMSSSEQRDDLRFRWVKIDIDEANFTSQSEKLKEPRLPEESDDYTCFHVKMGFEKTDICLSDILWNTGDAMDPDRRNFNLAALNALVAKGTNSVPTALDDDVVALHGHKSYRRLEDKTTTVKSLNFTQGKARKLWFHGYSNDSFIVTEQDCFKYFLPAVSVAEFLDDYLTTSKTLKDIRDTLVGVKVRISGQRGQEEKHIVRLGELPATVRESRKHPVWIAKDSATLRYADLPCVVVKSNGKEELLPAEMCKILPMQSAGKNVPFAVQMAGLKERHEAIRSLKAPSGFPTQESVYPFSHQKMTVADGKKKFAAAFKSPPKILFVEAGSGEKPPSGWKGLCKRVVSNTVTTGEDNIDVTDADITETTISLAYKPGTNPTKLWEKQLHKFTAKHASSSGENVLLVVAIMAGQHEKVIYETLKTICDTTTIGKQTYFVNMGTLASKQRESPSDGAKKAANEISQRMRIRNPPQARNPEDSDISIGIHVNQFAAQTSVILDDGSLEQKQEEVFLVTTVSREVKHACGHKTTRELVDKTVMDKFDASLHIKPHLQGRKPGHIIIFRSGYLPASSGNDSTGTVDGRSMTKDSESVITASADFELSKFQTDGTLHTANFKTDARRVERSITAATNTELAGLQAAFKDKRVSYILVDESDAVEITASERAKIARECGSAVNGTAARDGTSFFINTFSQPRTNKHEILAHRKMSPKNGGGKMVSLTLLGVELHDGVEAEEPSSTQASVADDRSSHSQDLGDVEDNSTPRARHNPGQMLKRGSWTYDADGNLISETPAVFAPAPPDSEFQDLRHERMAEDAASNPNTDAYHLGLQHTDRPIRSLGHGPHTARPYPRPEMPATSYADSGVGTMSSSSGGGRRTGDSEQQSQSTGVTAPESAPSDTAKPKGNREQSLDSGADLGLDDKINSAELEILAGLFYDTQLELYDTKVPIPTYLAKAASKRAAMHLRRTLEVETEQIVLPEVAAEVASSLYYL